MNTDSGKPIGNAYLIREEMSSHGTFGRFVYSDSGDSCYCGELPWKDNQNDISCIPAGIYRCTRRSANKWMVHDVPGRTAIQMHIGNWCGDVKLGYKSDVEGCILLGTGRGLRKDGKAHHLNSSRIAFEAFARYVEWKGIDEFYLHVINRCHIAYTPDAVKGDD